MGSRGDQFSLVCRKVRAQIRNRHDLFCVRGDSQRDSAESWSVEKSSGSDQKQAQSDSHHPFGPQTTTHSICIQLLVNNI